jgi:hypothetical protein
MRLNDLGWWLIELSHRCCLGRSFDDVFEVGLATTLWREVLAPGDALISTPPGLQEVRGTLRAPRCGCSHSLVELPYDSVLTTIA